MKDTNNYNLAFLKLNRAFISVQKAQHILARGHNIDEIATADSRALHKFGLSEKEIQLWQDYDATQQESDLAWLQKSENHLLTILDKAYPPLLKEIADPPLILFVKGDVDLLSAPQLAIVGSRNPTLVGKDSAYDFAKYLAASGLVVTSGLATGVDAASHEGAIAAKGATIAVCGTGLDRVYPAKHRTLAQQIAQNGALVSEFPLGAGPQAFHFPRRNRIISGLSVGTLVVEAAIKSGSLITARLAGEYGREIFAIPGSIHNPLARGCHRLIRQGAKLVETANDIIEELAPLVEFNQRADPKLLENNTTAPILDEEYANLLPFIGYETTAVDVIVSQSGLAADAVASMLLILELNSYVKKQPGGYVRLK